MAATDRRKRAVFIINSLAGGGAERIMTTLLRASEPWRERYEISLVLLDNEPGAYPIPDWVSVVQFDSGGRLIPGVFALRRLLRELKPNVTLSFLTRANMCNVVATRGLRCACVISERVNSSAHFSGGFGAFVSKLLLRMSYPRADHVIAVSSGVAQDLTRNFAVPKSRISVLFNPVDHELIETLGTAPSAVPVEDDYVVATGRLVPNKNFPMLIEAFAQSGLPGSLVIMGEGPDRAKLEAQVEQFGLTGRVLLPGFVDNPFAVLKRASVFALPSNAEGFPNGLVEAMACGLPVVATNCASGPSEILLDRAREAVQGTVSCPAGAVVPTNDAGAFAEALRIVHDPVARAAKGTAALAIARQFNIAQTTGRYWQIMEDAIAGFSQSPLSVPRGGMQREGATCSD